MTIEEIKKRKQELGLSNKQLAERSGIPLGTVQKILSGETKSPRFNTISALSKALSINREGKTAYYNTVSSASYVSEPEPAYKVFPTYLREDAGEKTIDDYIALPEGTRVELIDGKFYDMAGPSNIHQMIAGEIYTEFNNFVRKNGGPCIPFISPADVQLDCDNKTMVQPDVFVVCNRDKVTYPRTVGAPDLVIEVVSPSNCFVDMMIKLRKYRNACVREYWLIFPFDKKVAVYKFEDLKPDSDIDDNPKLYSFEDEIPVGIWNDKCIIDMKEIYKRIEFLY